MTIAPSPRGRSSVLAIRLLRRLPQPAASRGHRARGGDARAERRLISGAVAHGERLEALDADIAVDDRYREDDFRYRLDLSPDGMRVRASVGLGLLEPSVSVGEHRYRVEYAEGRVDDPAVIIRNRPRRIVFNTNHPAHNSGDRARKYSVSLALELAYLRDSTDAASVYDQMMRFLEVL
jgi:hypothetical protein